MEKAILKGIILLLTCFLRGAESGECCRAYYDITFTWHDAKWCTNYCCYELSKYDCCDNILLQAPDDDREDLCEDWFKQHVWAPILIAIFGIASIVGCCVCCYKCCCASNRTGVIIHQQQPGGPGVTVVSNSQQQQMGGMPSGPPQVSYDPYRSGYDQSGGYGKNTIN